MALEETSVGKGIIARLNRLDKEIVHRHWRENLNPVLGVIKPRFYDRDILLKVYRDINGLADKLIMYEDAVVYYEAYKLSNSCLTDVGYVERAIYHLEEESLFRYMKKWYKYGKSSKILKHTEYEFFL
ncbi:glycosyl transferase family 2, partial [Sulfolobus sp. B5]